MQANNFLVESAFKIVRQSKIADNVFKFKCV